jgi:hypothetical protein
MKDLDVQAFPETFGILGMGWHQITLLTKVQPCDIQGTGDRRGAAAVYAEDAEWGCSCSQ